MIITIDGLPEGQQVTSIKVDVQFTDGTADVKTNVDTTIDTTHVVFTDDVPKAPQTPTLDREAKEIPAEMKDQEF